MFENQPEDLKKTDIQGNKFGRFEPTYAWDIQVLGVQERGHTKEEILEISNTHKFINCSH